MSDNGSVGRAPIIVFSGQGPVSHGDARDLARRLGCQVSGAVKIGVDALVIGDDPSTMKVRQAERLGIPIITYEDWIASSGAAALIAEADHADGLLHIPGGYPDDIPASDSQLEAVLKFYASQEFAALTCDQAGALLDYRDFARAAIARLGGDLNGEPARAASETAAIFLSRHRELAEGVVSMMRKRFDQGADPDKLSAAVARTEMFEAIERLFE